MKNRFLSLVAAASVAFSTLSPTVFADFSSYYSGAPDYSVSSIYQTPDSYNYSIRVCNSGDTPSRAGTLRVSLERSGKPAESRTYGNTFIANGACQDFQLEGIYSFGKYNERNYSIYAVVTWDGDRADKNTDNNRKLFPAAAGATGVYSKTNSTTTTTRKDPLSDLWKTADPSQKYKYTNASFPGVWTNYSWYVPANKYVAGTSGYYSSYTSPNTYSNGSYDRPNFFPVRIAVDGSQQYIMATYCNDGADMSSFQDVRLRFENKMSGSKNDYTEYIKLLSGQCRDISVSLSSFAVKYPGNYTFSVKVDSDDRIWERNEADNTYTTDVTVNYTNTISCYYSSGYYYDSNNNRYSDAECHYGVTSYNNGCYYTDGYYTRDGVRYTDYNCSNRYYYNNGTSYGNNYCNYNTDGYYYKNGYQYTDSTCSTLYDGGYRYGNTTNYPTYSNSNDGYYSNGNWYYNNGVYFNGSNNYSSCTYRDGGYYLNGYRYSDSSCRYRTDGYSSPSYNSSPYYYNNGNASCTYKDGYYYANGSWYLDASCENLKRF